MISFKVGNFYKAKNYKESGYKFPSGNYKLKMVTDGFPEKHINDEDELIIAKEQWLEGMIGSEQYDADMNSNWYYWKFPDNNDDIEYMWIPESVVLEVFIPINN